MSFEMLKSTLVANSAKRLMIHCNGLRLAEYYSNRFFPVIMSQVALSSEFRHKIDANWLFKKDVLFTKQCQKDVVLLSL